MSREGCAPTKFTSTTVLFACAECARPDLGLQVLDSMHAARCALNPITCSALLLLIARAGAESEATTELINRLEQRGKGFGGAAVQLLRDKQLSDGQVGLSGLCAACAHDIAG